MGYSMQASEIKALIEANIPDSTAEVSIDGSHASVTVVSPVFAGLNPVKKQQLVYAGLNEHIASGAIHAVHIKTFTPDQWQANNA